MSEDKLIYNVLTEISANNYITELNYPKDFCSTLESLIDSSLVNGTINPTKTGRIFKIHSLSSQAIDFMEKFK